MTSPYQTPNVIYYDEPPRKSPPILVAGPLAWIRKNLFNSLFDTILTFISAFIFVTTIISAIRWIISEANWFIIIFNLRQLMIGRYQPDAEWRVTIGVILIVFALGYALATWTRGFPRVLLMIIIVFSVFSFIVPPIISATLPQPFSYLAAGDVEIVSGSASDRPQSALAFTGRAGEVVTVRVAQHLSADDTALSQLSGFSDNVSNLVRAAASNRLNAQARRAELEGLLAGDALTSGQRARLEAEYERLTISDPIVTTYQLNSNPVSVTIRRGTSGESIAAAQLVAGGEALSVTLPEEGWYIIEKTVVGEGLAILETTGIYPFLLRNITRTETVDGRVIGGQVAQYVRMFNSFTTEEPRPTLDGEQVPIINTVNFQYRGNRDLGGYLRLFLGPFLADINGPLLALLLAGAAGYFASKLTDRFYATDKKPRPSRDVGTWLLIVSPIVFFVLILGVGNVLPLTDTRLWGGLLLTFLLTVVGIVGSFPLGVLLALGRRSSMPIISIVCTFYIEFVRGVPLITVLFTAQLLLPFANPALAEIPNVYRAMVAILLFSAAYLAENVRGGLQSIPPGQEEAARALGFSGWQIIRYITLPQALRAVIPALVGQFISLFKDTSLVAIVGLLDLTSMSEIIVTQTEFLGLRRESYVFIILIYFVFSYAMSIISRRIEASGSGAARRI